MAKLATLLFCLVASIPLARAQGVEADHWAPIRFLQGHWKATVTAEKGHGTVTRQYKFILSSRFLQERSNSAFPPQEKIKDGEALQQWSFFVYDTNRKVIVARQFHQEGYGGTYVFNPALSTATKLVFECDQLDTLPKPWKARETYEVVSKDEFNETFEISKPDQPFQVFCRCDFKRFQP